MKMKFTGKVVLITGAGSGIGAETAKRFANLGATLGLADKNSENLKCVAGEITKCKSANHPEPLLSTVDVSNENERKCLIEETIKKFGKLDVLVNNAGIFEAGSIETTSLEQYDKIMDTNVKSMYHLTMLAVPHLIETKGNVINLSSINGLRAFAGVLAYCVSKAAINHFTKCVALDLAPKQVRVNAVNPGVCRTNLFTSGGQTLEESNAYMKRAGETHPLGRAGKPEEIARAIVFLASDEDAGFITGISLSVDGGRNELCPR